MYAVIPNESPLSQYPRERIIHRYPGFALALLDADTALPDGAGYFTGDEIITVNGQQVAIPEGRFERNGTPRSLARFAGPIAPDWRQRLVELGIVIHFWCPPYGLCIELPPNLEPEDLRVRLPAMVGLQDFREAQCTRRLRAQNAGVRRIAGRPEDWLDVVCFSAEQCADIAVRLRGQGARVLDTSRYKLRVATEILPRELRRMPGVKVVDVARTPILAWEPLLAATGIPSTGGAGESGDRLSGKGQVVAVADTGLDQGETDGDMLHEDFRGRVKALSSWPINQSWQSYVTDLTDDGPADKNSGHGTHVAGLAVGDGSRSHGKYAGVAPQADLVFQAIEQHTQVASRHQDRIPTGYYLNGRPLDLRRLFQQARDQGARIHVNAWGDPADGQYTDDSYECDLFLWKNPDALILFAAGNAGSDRDADRSPDEGSLYAPASAKNVTAVGATEGPRQGVGYRGGWSGFDVDRRRFANPSDRSDPVSGEPDRIALISSTGPTSDGRIKPDVCTPGTNLPAPRSRATAARGWGLASPLPHYMYLGGTSMATGVAGGFAALVRQAWQEHLAAPPSGAALKALMIFGAQPVRKRADTSAENLNVAGFGRLQLPGCLPSRSTILVDDPSRALSTGEIYELSFDLAQEARFRAVLAWYDHPGERLINDLDLCLIRPGQSPVWGNYSPGTDGSADRTNTVERIELPRLPAGSYVLRVIGANVPADSQSFALVLNRPTGPEAAKTTGNKIPVEWLKGVGATYERRLQEAGIVNLGAILALDTAKLARVLATTPSRVGRLRQRLDALKALLDGPGFDLPPSINLAQISADDRPPQVEYVRWQSERTRLLTLLEVFDKDVRHRITLEDLL